MPEFLQHPWDAGPARFIDLAVVAVLLYLGMVWLKHRASRALAGVLILIAVLYVAARLLDMPMTLVVFREGFTVIAVALLLIFQRDLRWAFERLVSTTGWRKRRHDPSGGVIEVLVESVASLTASRTGALIAIEGAEPLDRHLRGGISLDSRISIPLLLSLFEVHSPGHDGALVIKHSRAQSFGVHLPLSVAALPGRLGTRHSAGLGLAEVVDAFVIVVSEERGTISVARDGVLTEVSVSELKQQLDAYYTEKFATPRRRGMRHYITRNWGLKLAALLLAGGLSLLFADRARVVHRSFEVPVEYRNLPPRWIIENSSPARVQITVSGSESAFDLLDASRLKVALDAGRLTDGSQLVQISEDSVNLRPPLRIRRIAPTEIRVTAHRLQPVNVAVQVPQVGSLPNGVTLVRVQPAPSTVSLLWPVSRSQPPSEVLTEPLNLRRITRSQTVRLRLRVPENARLADQQDATISVEVQVRTIAAKKQPQGKPSPMKK